MRNKVRFSVITAFVIQIFVTNIVNAQNLVPNAGFEDTVSCPFSSGQINNTQSWHSATMGTPDYFHSCNGEIISVPYNYFGIQSAHTGTAYAGIYTFFSPTPNIREYLQVQLTSPLNSGWNYNIEFYVSMADTCMYATDNLGVFFSCNPVYQGDFYNIDSMPQIENDTANPLANKTGWTKISGTYTATGGEEYITIGNFKPDSLADTASVAGGTSFSAYYYIDDVSVIPDSSSAIYNFDTENLFECYVYDRKLKVNTHDVNQKYYIEIYSITGTLLKQIQLLEGDNYILLDDLQQGIYFGCIKNSKAVILIKKFIMTS